ncbi:hypothetical protein BpHYR1_003080 [Brachionus plicatilis]|uniref:Uncharacterized protein n=1 Tax=Brachionus plicatilis TaxID=10195 RepID=A0A3M7QM98_BRAPC|nr:hypothetical protein BpHYR1_003080 [Brachionus plicatilis]
MSCSLKKVTGSKSSPSSLSSSSQTSSSWSLEPGDRLCCSSSFWRVSASACCIFFLLSYSFSISWSLNSSRLNLSTSSRSKVACLISLSKSCTSKVSMLPWSTCLGSRVWISWALRLDRAALR